MRNFLKTRKKLVLAIILGLLIVILAILPGAKKKTVEPNPNKQIKIPAFNQNINPQPSAAIKTLLQIKQVQVFEPLKFNQGQIADLFYPIADELKFPNNPQTINIDQAPHLYWENSPNSFAVDLITNSFSLNLKKNVSSSGQVSETDALLFAKNWLINHRMISNETAYETSYLQDINYELSVTDNPDQADAYMFSFFPTINNLPIFITDSFDPPISVTVNKFGNITSISYRLPALFFANQPELKQTQKPILTTKQIETKINNKEAVIFSAIDADNMFIPSTKNLNNLTYTKIELGYSNDFSLGYFLPMFRLTGTGTLDDGSTVAVTAYLPALAE